jgi:hypothetical protein
VEQLLLERMLQQLACRGEGALLGRASGQAPPHLLTTASSTHYGLTYSPRPHLLTMASPTHDGLTYSLWPYLLTMAPPTYYGPTYSL